MDRLLLASGVELAQLIRERHVSSREVVDAHLRRIEQVQPRINALAADRFEAALIEADAADRRVARGGALPPFLGVPCTVKESVALAGCPHTSGLVARRGVRAHVDATSVARLKAAGGIFVGVTNVSELCMWMETSNRIYGRTNNPYDPSRTVGGSSGGEGAVIGAGGVPFGIGADVGGSIRMPAYFNGVFGHKPTGGTVPHTGHHPVSENDVERYNTVGPLARRAEDLWPLLSAMAGPDGIDGGCRPMALGDPEAVDLATLTVYDAQQPAAPPLLAAKRRAADALADSGARVDPIEHRAFRIGFDIWSAMMSASGGTPFSVHLGNGKPTRRLRELARWAVGRSPHTLAALGLAVVEDLPKLMPGRAAKAVAIGRALRDELAATLGDRAVMLYPSFPIVAPRHYRLLATPHYAGYAGLFNVLEFPATQVPMGLDPRGLPVGVQVVGGPGMDHLTVAVALELERRCGGWIPPRA